MNSRCRHERICDGIKFADNADVSLRVACKFIGQIALNGIINFLKQSLRFFIDRANKISVRIWILLILVTGVFFPTQALLVAIILWWMDRHKYQSLQAPPKLKADQIGAGRFTWISLEAKWVPEIFRPEREASGLIWEGFTTGISRENGKPGSIAVWLYGSNEGVGHYVYLERTNKIRSHYRDGHFGLKVYARDDKRWALDVLHGACERVAKDVGQFYRPLVTSYDAKRKRVEWYDDESGREVYFREDRAGPSDDLFVFGPYPKKLKDFAGDTGTPGLMTAQVEREGENLSRIIVRAKDIYGQPLKHVRVEVESPEPGYKYAQELPPDGEAAKISLPWGLQKLALRVCRGGYGTVTEEIDVAAGDIKVDAILEPSREDE